MTETKSAGLTDTGFWSRFWSRFAGRPQLDQGDRATPYDGETTPAGSTVSIDTSLKLPVVFACAGLRASTVSSLPLNLLDKGKEVASDHPLQGLLHDAPNADMTASEYWESQTAVVDLWGNSFTKIERNNSKTKIVALTPFDPRRMAVKRMDSGRLRYEYTRGGNVELYDEADVFHIKGFTLDGLVGLSRIQYAAEAIGGLMDANTVSRKEWQTGLKIGGFVKMPAATIDPKQRQSLLSRFAEFSKTENAGRWLPLEQGMEPVPTDKMRLSPVDAQLLQSRYFGIEEICRAFGVPPPLIGHTDKASSWASSLESLNRAFLSYSLRPTLRRIEQAIARKLLRPEERSTYSVKFNVKALLRADTAGQTAFYASALQNGYLNRDEVRDLEDDPPIPGGKGQQYTVQLNMAPLGSTPPPASPATGATP